MEQSNKAPGKQEYLELVTVQMRCQKARDMVAEELAGHIEDQTETYLEFGLPYEEAAARAVEQLRSNIKDVSAEVLPLGSKHMVTAFGSNSREECNTFVRSYRDIYPDLWVYNKR